MQNLQINQKTIISPNIFEGWTPPEAAPVADDQGVYPLCTYFALSKAICSGFYRGKFNGTAGKSVDIDNQKSVKDSLVNEFKDLSAKFPTEFDRSEVLLWDSQGNAWNTRIYVSTIPSMEKELTPVNLSSFEYLIQYRPYRFDDQSHCIYVDYLSADAKAVHCINSWKDHKYPKVPINCIDFLYRVTCDTCMR